MNEQFYSLTKRKQKQIIEFGFDEFIQNEYTDASLENVAKKAELSIELLQYIFEDKKSFFSFLHQTAEEHIKKAVLDEKFTSITDFFDLCIHAMNRKHGLMNTSPQIMKFIIRSITPSLAEASGGLSPHMQKISSDVFDAYFAAVDFSKFKNDVDPQEIFKMLIWTSDGYIREQHYKNAPVDNDRLYEKFCSRVDLLKKASYKEEYL